MYSLYKPRFETTHLLTALAVLLIAIMPDLSFAQGTGGGGAAEGADEIMDAVCAVIKALQGPVARGVAAFGIIFLGFSLFLGKISWGTGIALAIGLGAVFGAKTIVGALGKTKQGFCE
ncbi:MAG: TrbC/VirB2 family protein [Rickettsiales bacterium]